MSASASSAAVLSVVRHVTANKQNKVIARLAELDEYVKESANVLSGASSDATGSELESQVLALLKTLRKAFPGDVHKSVRIRGGNYVDFKDRLDTIERMLWETKFSPGFSDAAPQAWKKELSDYLRQAEQRMAYTALFGRLTNEWAEHRFGELSSASAPKTTLKPASTSMSDDNDQVAVGRGEMYEQRQIWESHVTVRRETDTAKIVSFLDNLFTTDGKPKASKADDDAPTDPRVTHLRKIRRQLHKTCKASIRITTSAVMSAIDAVLSADQLTSEKRRAMQDIRNRETIIDEIVDILTIDGELSALRKRSFSETPINMQMRKAINSKYRVYLDLELLDAILIQIVGQHVSIQIKHALDNTFDKEFGEDVEARFTALDRQIELVSHRRMGAVHQVRSRIYEQVFAAGRLPKSMEDEAGEYDDSASETDEGLADLVNGISSKFNLRRDILRICSAEMGVQKLVYGQFCILQSDFEWFGPSIPHTTLLAIMKYFNMPVEITEFVESFLGMHMRFQEDGPDGPTLVRRTGIPLSFQLTDGISELLLYTLDLAVAQRTGGVKLYRNHDDLWFWGQPKECAIAWDTICEFTELMGLRLNKDKTAFARAVDEANPRYVPVDEEVISGLPSGGKMKWGLLCFDEAEWRWVADNSAVEKHIDELRFQLKSRTSVMAYVQAYNAYVENFLPNNFCPVVTGLGDSHANMVLQSLQHAQRYLFGDAGNVAQHVRELIRERFSQDGGRYDSVPDCFLYESINEGGLGLANPAPAFAKYVDVTRENDAKGDQEDDEALPPMEKALAEVKRGLSSKYREDKTKYVNKRRREMAKKQQKGSDDDGDDDLEAEFMSFSDYVASSEQHSTYLRDMYATLLDEPQVSSASDLLGKAGWVSTVFGAQIDELFGGSVAEKQLLSLKLYQTLAEEKVRWEG